jgi:hypothetical protein
MICEAVKSGTGIHTQNQPAISIHTCSGRSVAGGSQNRTDAELLTSKAQLPKPAFRPEDFIWLELSRVPDVEYVFVEKDEGSRSFSVLTVVKNNTEAVRTSIYQREKCVIRAHPGSDFDFHIVAAADHSVDEIISRTKEKPYKRIAPAA